MSNCGISLYSYEGQEENHFNFRMQRTACTHICYECGKTIPAQEEHEHAQWWDNEATKWIHVFCCATCSEIGWAFSDCRLYGALWDGMYDSFEDGINTMCFTKLRTVEAKKALQTAWMDWRGLLPKEVSVTQ